MFASGTKIIVDYWSGAAATAPLKEHFYSSPRFCFMLSGAGR
jgi:hypothetical protein